MFKWRSEWTKTKLAKVNKVLSGTAAYLFNSNKVDANSGTTKLAESNEKYNYQYKVEVFPYNRK